ncbi:MAG: site-specific integrase [Ignavibacteriaceae bacterium]|nr:site-specific integrase [Ignavibacteriaceae bacterium]
MGALKDKMLLKMDLKNFSERIKVIYLHHMKMLVRHYGKSPDLLGSEEVESYIHSIYEKKKSSSGILQCYSALKFFYAAVLGKEDVVGKIIRPLQQQKLPIVLSPVEVKHILDSVKNLKTRVILMTIYSGGLNKQSNEWVRAKKANHKNFFIHVNVISALYKKKFLYYLKKAYNNRGLVSAGSIGGGENKCSNTKPGEQYGRTDEQIFNTVWLCPKCKSGQIRCTAISIRAA